MTPFYIHAYTYSNEKIDDIITYEDKFTQSILLLRRQCPCDTQIKPLRSATRLKRVVY